MCEEHPFFDFAPFLLCHFLLISSSTPPPPPFPKWRTCWMVPIKIYGLAMGDILCDDIMNER